MGMPQARIGDMCMCTVISLTPVGAPIPGPTPLAFVGAPTVLVGSQPAARVGDNHVGLGPHPVAMGSFTVLMQSMPAARIGDMTGCGGAVTQGLPTVLTG